MKKYNVNEVVGNLSRVSGINISGKKITVSSGQGLTVWGMIDFLKNHANYSIVILN